MVSINAKNGPGNFPDIVTLASSHGPSDNSAIAINTLLPENVFPPENTCINVRYYYSKNTCLPICLKSKLSINLTN